MKRNLEVVLSPALLPFYEIKNKTVVVIDILRASSSICVAFNTGVKKIIPVSTPEECRIFKDFDFLCAAERNAMKVEGFNLGNSPFEYQNPLLKERSIAFTTTNGTRAIKLSKEMNAAQIVIGAFLNLEYLCNWLKKQEHSVVLLCAGWKNMFSTEDTLFAGAVVENVKTTFDIDCDSSMMAEQFYIQSKINLEQIVRQSSHARRLKSLNVSDEDLKFCLQLNQFQLIPVMKGEYLEKM